MNKGLAVVWHDMSREAQCPPDPAFPDGVAVDLASSLAPDTPRCSLDLQYPAPRIGVHIINCQVCGWKIGLTTAGRPDDPRSITLPCRVAGGVH
jgi:hypothetical protein